MLAILTLDDQVPVRVAARLSQLSDFLRILPGIIQKSPDMAAHVAERFMQVNDMEFDLHLSAWLTSKPGTAKEDARLIADRVSKVLFDGEIAIERLLASNVADELEAARSVAKQVEIEAMQTEAAVIRAAAECGLIIDHVFEESEESEPAVDAPKIMEPGPSRQLTFSAGQISCNGRSVDVVGLPLKIVKAIWDARNHRMFSSDIIKAVWEEGFGGEAELRTHISKARADLRKLLKCGPKHNPIPCVDRGSGATGYCIDLGKSRLTNS